MIAKSRIYLATLVLSAGLGFTACSDDEPPEEPVAEVPDEMPATPPAPPAMDEGAATQTVYFAFDDYTLNADAQQSLSKLAEFMKASSDVVVQIEGHCDERGSVEYNLALGERRAQSVKNYLTQIGIDGARLPTISYGEEKPAAQGHDEAAWSQNRRSEFAVSRP